MCTTASQSTSRARSSLSRACNAIFVSAKAVHVHSRGLHCVPEEVWPEPPNMFGLWVVGSRKERARMQSVILQTPLFRAYFQGRKGYCPGVPSFSLAVSFLLWHGILLDILLFIAAQESPGIRSGRGFANASIDYSEFTPGLETPVTK